MTVSVADFREAYPEFKDPQRFPEGFLNRWLVFAGKMVANTDRWGDLIDEGQMLWAAHNIALQVQAQDESSNGAQPGTMKGPVNNESVDKVSVGFDTTAATIKDAGDYNLTTYGVRFKRIADMIGAGPVQVGAVCDPNDLNGPAWPGPWQPLFPNPSG